MTAEMHQLEAEVAALASLDRTERAARERLGMVPARNIQYISVSVEAPADPCCRGHLLNTRSRYRHLPSPGGVRSTRRCRFLDLDELNSASLAKTRAGSR